MKSQFEYFFKSMFTRKFVLAVGSFLVFVGNGQTLEAMGVILTYLGVEGIADIKERGKTVDVVQISPEAIVEQKVV